MNITFIENDIMENKAYLQLWEISDKKSGLISDGCSLHINLTDRQSYVDMIYQPLKGSKRTPSIYERVVGIPSIIYLNDTLYDILLNEGYIRLREYEMNNLIEMNEIIINNLYD